MPILLKPLQKLETLYEAIIIPILIPDKGITRKEKSQHKPQFPMNVDTKSSNTRNLIQQHIKMIIHCDQIGFIHGLQGGFNIQNQST